MSEFEETTPSVSKGLGEPPKLSIPPRGGTATPSSSAPSEAARPVEDFSAANAYNPTVEKPVLSKKEQKAAEREARPVPTEEELAAKAVKRKKALKVTAGVTVGVLASGSFAFWAATRPPGPDPVIANYSEVADNYDAVKAERAAIICASADEAVASLDAYERLGENRAALLDYPSRPQFIGGAEVSMELSYVLADAYNLVNPSTLPDWALKLAENYGGEANPEEACVTHEAAPLSRVSSPQARDVEAVNVELSNLEKDIENLSTEQNGRSPIPVDLWAAAEDDKEALLSLMALAVSGEELEALYPTAQEADMATALEARTQLAETEAILREQEYSLDLWINSLDALIQYTIATENLELTTSANPVPPEDTADEEN